MARRDRCIKYDQHNSPALSCKNHFSSFLDLHYCSVSQTDIKTVSSPWGSETALINQYVNWPAPKLPKATQL